MFRADVRGTRASLSEALFADRGQRRIHRTGDVSSSKLIRFPDIDQNGAGGSAVLTQASIDVFQ